MESVEKVAGVGREQALDWVTFRPNVRASIEEFSSFSSSSDGMSYGDMIAISNLKIENAQEIEVFIVN